MNKEATTRYLLALGLPLPTIHEYVAHGKITCSSPMGIIEPTPDIKQIMIQVQELVGHEYEIYHIVISEMFGCMIYNYLLRPVAVDEDDYIFEGLKEGCVLSYSWNTTVPEYSEVGDIYVWFNQKTKALKRIG